MKQLFLAPFLIALLTQGCAKSTGEAPGDGGPVVVKPVTDSIQKAGYNLSLLDKTTVFATAPEVTALINQTHGELSGVAPSHSSPGKLYVHEDSGNGNEVYITDTQGRDFGKIILDGVANRDWEDIECGPGPDNSKNYVYVAEIGDNDFQYRSIFVYRFPEPDLSLTGPQSTVHVTPEKLQFVYPGGPTNAESLLLDPLTKDLYIATKEVGKSGLFVARYPQSVTATTTLTQLAAMPFDLLTGGDISADGTELVVRNTGQIWYWKLQAGETIVKAMLRKPQDAPYARNEHQGEGVCFAADGSGYYTISETKKFPGDQSALSFYKRK